MWVTLGVGSLLDTFLPGPNGAAAGQNDALGSFPPEWWEKWGARAKFTEDG